MGFGSKVKEAFKEKYENYKKDRNEKRAYDKIVSDRVLAARRKAKADASVENAGRIETARAKAFADKEIEQINKPKQSFSNPLGGSSLLQGTFGGFNQAPLKKIPKVHHVNTQPSFHPIWGNKY